MKSKAQEKPHKFQLKTKKQEAESDRGAEVTGASTE